MAEKCYNIPNIFESLSMDVASGRMTKEQAAEELNRCNHTPFIDVERTRHILEPYIARINAQKGAEK